MSAAFDAMSAREMVARVARREVSPLELTRRALERAEATQASLNCFSALAPEAALAQAR